MRKYITLALIGIGLIALIVWSISQYLVPILPPSITGGLILFFVVLVTVSTFIANLKPISEFAQSLFEPRKRDQLPVLVLKFINTDELIQDELAFTQTNSNQDFPFGFILENTSKSSIPAEKIDIRVEAFWEGGMLNAAPKFSTDWQNRTTPGWHSERNLIQQQGDIPHPAVLVFHGSEQDRCAYGHPLVWKRFSLTLAEKVNGHFVIHYRISTVRPVTNTSGQLRIKIG